MSRSSIANNARAALVKPLYIIFNLLILLNVHTYQTNAASSTRSGRNNMDNTTTDSLNSEQITLPSIVTEFLNRLQKNGVDDIAMIDLVFFGCVVLLGLEFVGHFVLKFCEYFRSDKTVPVRGKHLDDLGSTDVLFITLNKIATVPFMYILTKFMYHEPNAIWSLSNVTFQNTILPLPAIFIIYDFFYTILHWALHIQAVYAYIHKHHHRQKAPSRGTVDAVNVHPVEFFLGEYNHLFAIYIYTNLLGFHLHVLGSILLFIVAAILAGLNHARYDSSLTIFGITLYDSKWHDVHHRIPQSNYAQYINIWDLTFGTFRAYDSKDRVNPMAQLNPKTGKSLEYGKKYN